MENDYVTLFLNSPQVSGSPIHLGTLFVLCLLRLMPIVALAPFLGAKLLNRPAKVFFGIILFVVLFPTIIQTVHEPVPFDARFIGLALKELLVGTIIAILTAMPFYVAESTGVIIDHQRGASSLMVNDPIIQSQNAPTGVFFNMVGVVLFFWIGGPFIFIEALSESFISLPPDKFLSEFFFSQEHPFFGTTIAMIHIEFSTAVRLASPSLIAMLMTDMFLGLANRLAPQVMITFLGLPLKGYIGIAAIWFAWVLILKAFVGTYYHWLEDAFEFVRSLAF